jgi:hypothetical protein
MVREAGGLARRKLHRPQMIQQQKRINIVSFRRRERAPHRHSGSFHYALAIDHT